MSRVNRYEYKDWKEFGSRVKNFREQVSMTKELFAERINRSENCVAELEKGNMGCSVHTLHQISKVLKVPVDRLLYGEVEMTKDYSNKEILQNIIDRCDEDELAILKDIVVATFPNIDTIKKKRKSEE